MKSRSFTRELFCFILFFFQISLFPSVGRTCSYIDQVSAIPLPVNPEQMVVQDTIAYIVQGADSLGITIVNLADPMSPQVIATIDTVSLRNYVTSVAVDSNILYVGTAEFAPGDGGVVARFDISDPSNPVQLLGFHIPFGGAHRLAVQNHQVYVATRTADFQTGYTQLNFSDSANPTEVGHDLWNFAPGWVQDIGVSGQYVYLAAADSGLLIYDNSLSPTSGPVNVIKFTTGIGDFGVNKVSLQGNRMLLSGSNGFGTYALKLFDISNPSTPVAIGLKTMPAGGGKIVNNYFLWISLGSLLIDDSSDFTPNSWYGQEDIPGTFEDFHYSGDLIYAVCQNKINFSDNDSLKVFRFTGIPRPPIFYPIPTQYVNEAQHLEFDVRAYDLDACQVGVDTTQPLPSNFSVSGYAGGLDPTTDSLHISFDPDWTQAGTYNLLFRATDADDTTYYTVTVIVNDRTPLYNPPIDYSFPDNASGPHGITAADFDNDGDIDIVETSSSWVSGNNYTGILRILDNDSTGIYTLIEEDTLPHKPAAPASGDLNGDSMPDLVVAYYDFNNIPGYDSVAVMLNNGDGTFAPQVFYQAGPAARGVHLFDADGDNDLDIAARDFDDSTIAILFNSGNGTFGPPTFFVAAGQAQTIASGDIDGDNDQDLLIPSRRLFPWKPEMQIYLNDGFGAFTLDTAFISSPTISDVKTGDMDGDGDLDFVMGRDDTVTVMLNNGSGQFTVRHEYLTARYSLFLQLDDVDGNGSLDVIDGTNQNGEIEILLNNGDGTLQPAISYDIGNGLEGVESADVDGDTDIDIIVANQATSGIQILKNNTLLSNHPPVFQPLNAGLLSVIEGDTLAVTIQVNDGDGQVPTINSSGLPSGATLTDNNNGTADLFFVPGSNQAGKYPFSLFASDGLEVTQQDLVMVVFNGDGLFNYPVDYILSGTPTAMLTTDVDNDNDIDIAVSTVTPHAVEIWSNDGAAAFQFLGSNGLSGPPSAIATGDFDGDLDNDLAVSSDSANVTDVLLNNGNGSFAAPVTYPLGGIAVVAADFDLDSDIDLAVARADSTEGVYYLENDSAGIFAPAVWFPAGAKPADMIGDDFDGNGSVDLAVADGATGHVWILLSNSSGFAQAVPYAAGRQLAHITSADLDNDADIDLVVSSSAYDTVGVLLNNGNGIFTLDWQGDFGYHASGLYAGILKPNDTVSLVGVGSSFNGTQYVTAVSHRMSGGSYQTDYSTDLYWSAGDPVAITGDRLDNDNDIDLIIIQSQGKRITVLTGNSDIFVDVNEDESTTIPMTFELSQNYPNPFNPSTTIEFSVPKKSEVVLEIFNILGQRVTTLMNRSLPAGNYTVDWNGTDYSGTAVATGIYFYRLRSGSDIVSSKKMLLLK